MKQIVIGFIGGIFLASSAVIGYLLFAPQAIENVQQIQQQEQFVQNTIESTGETAVIEQIVPDELKEQLEVTDLEVLNESIANQPNLWRAFLNGEERLSDPFFEFGCKEYQDTGSELIVNLFLDQANQAWVSESVGETLIGIGLLSFVEYDSITSYRNANPEVACLLLLQRAYEDYTVLSDQVTLDFSVNEVDGFPDSYDIIVRVNNIYLPLPEIGREAINGYTGSSREPILVANRFIFGYGDEGINVFDLRNWEKRTLFSFDWEGLRGVSSIITYDEESPVISFAFQYWEEMPQAIVLVYDMTNGLTESQQYMRSASLQWTMGSNEIFSLENKEDLQFLNQAVVQIIEYPEFDEQVASGEFPPNPGLQERTEWDYPSNDK